MTSHGGLEGAMGARWVKVARVPSSPGAIPRSLVVLIAGALILTGCTNGSAARPGVAGGTTTTHMLPSTPAPLLVFGATENFGISDYAVTTLDGSQVAVAHLPQPTRVASVSPTGLMLLTTAGTGPAATAAFWLADSTGKVTAVPAAAAAALGQGSVFGLWAFANGTTAATGTCPPNGGSPCQIVAVDLSSGATNDLLDVNTVAQGGGGPGTDAELAPDPADQTKIGVMVSQAVAPGGALETRIGLLPLAGGRSSLHALAGAPIGTSVAVSANGASLAFTGSLPGANDPSIEVVNASTGAMISSAVAVGDVLEGRPLFSPDGRRVVVPVRLGSGGGVSMLDVASGKLTTTTVSGGGPNLAAQVVGWVDNHTLAVNIVSTGPASSPFGSAQGQTPELVDAATGKTRPLPTTLGGLIAILHGG